MWLGIIIGLLLGAALGSIPAALSLAVIGGALGWAVSRPGADAVTAEAATGDSAEPEEPLSELQVLQEQMRQANRRIDLLEMQLREAGIIPEAAAAMPAQAEAEEQFDEELLPEEFLDEEDEVPEEAPAVAAAETAVLPASAVPPETRSGYPPALHSFGEGREEPPTPIIAPWLSEFAGRWIIGGNPLVKVGVLILFLGLAFLLRYVAEHTVVPVELRYAGVAAAGVGLLLFGWLWRNREDSYGLILQGAGIGVLYLTTLAAMKLHSLLPAEGMHPLIPPEAGFAILTGVAIFAVLLAVLQDSLALALAASLGGFAAPVLASSGSEHHLAFFAYLTVLNLGIAAIAWFKAWRVLNLTGFACTVFLAGSWGAKYYQPALFNLAEPFLLSLFVLYVLIAFLFARRTLADAAEVSGVSFEDRVLQAAPQVSYVDASLVFGVPMSVFGLQYQMVHSFENGPAFSALGFGLAYIFLAYVLFRRTGMRYALLSETMIALAVIFGSLSIPLGLEGKWTSAGWAIEAAGVYWVGVRQQKIHARLFALALLSGSAAYFVRDLTPGGDVSVLGGSWLSCAMLALSTWWCYRLLSRAPAEHLHAFERGMRPWLVAAGCLFVALLPFLLYPMNWASTLLAILGALAVIASGPVGESLLTGWGCAYQVLAGALYLSTLQLALGGTALASGWNGLLTAGVTGIALLASAWAALRRQNERNEGAGETDLLGGLPGLVLLGGLLFVNLAPLFVLPWRFAAMVWPVTGIATLWWAIRSRRWAALAFALGLQLIAGAVSLGCHLAWLDGVPGPADAKPFLHSGFWSPLLIAVAAFAAARLLHRRQGEPLSIALGWGALAWSAAWWAFAWEAECGRLLPPETAVPSLVGVTAITAGLWGTLANYLNWRQVGQATAAYLPVLAILLAYQIEAGVEHPLDGWGAFLWPLALLMHGLLLRGQKDWMAPELHGAVHAAGAWLLVVTAALEVHWHLAHWGGADSAWPMFGWLLAPLAYLWALSSGSLRKVWPLREFRDSYAVAGALPVVLFLLGWTLASTLMGNSAAPLPHVPLLNPLETGQIAVLLGIALWWRSLHEHRAFQESGAMLTAVLGATAFAAISSMVARTCHLWGGIAWEPSALQNSMLVQSSLSIVWGAIAIGLMLFANRSGTRWVWIAGAVLVAAVVGKLFLVELAAHGSVERIVSFIAVGVLLLVVGYFAPLPPRHSAEGGEALEQPTSSEAP